MKELEEGANALHAATYDRRQNRAFALIGVLGGLICSEADYLLEYLGGASTTLGSWGVIESAWENMSLWRFSASIWIACIAVPMYTLGCIAVIRQMQSTHKKLGTAFGASFLTGVLGGLFIHIILCVMPVTYKYLLDNASQELAVGAVDAMTSSFIWPFFLYYALLIIVPLILWCVYCFKRDGLYRPLTALIVVGITLISVTVSKLVPALEWLGVGAVSRMLAMWCFVAWRREKIAAKYKKEQDTI